jgi:hypothetical protein
MGSHRARLSQRGLGAREQKREGAEGEQERGIT